MANREPGERAEPAPPRPRQWSAAGYRLKNRVE